MYNSLVLFLWHLNHLKKFVLKLLYYVYDLKVSEYDG